MGLSNLSLTNFRNFTDVNIKFSQHLNLFYGDNASGKTSLIESIYFLFRGNSFNSVRNNNEIINSFHIKDGFILFAEISNKSNSQDKIGLQKKSSDNLLIKVNNEKIHNTFSLTTILATQIIIPRTFNLIDTNPNTRRKYIDWLMFHVKHDLITDWKNYNKLIKFRNKLLKNKSNKNEITNWDIQISRYFNLFDQQRRKLIKQIDLIFTKHCKIIFKELDINLAYKSPWMNNASNDNADIYIDSLTNNYLKDLKYGYTTTSLNNSDFIINASYNNNNHVKIDCKSYFSNGYKKIISYLLVFSQLEVYYDYSHKKPLLLIDDYFAELDNNTAFTLLNVLLDLPFQLCITSVSNHFKSIVAEPRFIGLIKSKDNKVFHVKQNKIVQEQIIDE